MEVTERNDGDVAILAVEGRLDAGTADELQARVNDVLSRGGKQLLIDGAKLSYISSSGLRILLLASKRLAGSSGKMAICSLNQQVHRVFEMTGLHSILDVVATPEAAVAKLRGD